MKINIYRLLAVVACAIFLAAPACAARKINVMVSIQPLAYFVERIGGERVAVSVMVPLSSNEHTYEPKPDQLRALSDAQMYVKVGSNLEFELTWMDKLRALNPDMIICDSAQGIDLMKMKEDVDETQVNYHGVDPHIWLSLRKAKMMVYNIRNTLIQIDPNHWKEYTDNSDGLIKEMYDLDNEIYDKLVNLKKRTFIVDHPSWGYFAQDYLLLQLAIESEGKKPAPQDLLALADQAKHLKLKTIFISSQFNQENAQAVVGVIKGKLVMIDPLSGDYLNNLRSVMNVLYKALK